MVTKKTPTRTTRIEVRTSKLEKAIIDKKAAASGMSVSAYCRSTALGQKVSYRLTPEEIECYKNLAQYAANFSRISNLLKKKDSAFAKEVAETAKLLKSHLSKIQ